MQTLRALFEKADFLNESRDFVSQRKVADMGLKTVRFGTGSKAAGSGLQLHGRSRAYRRSQPSSKTFVSRKEHCSKWTWP
jgi:hypothetical protein